MWLNTARTDGFMAIVFCLVQYYIRIIVQFKNSGERQFDDFNENQFRDEIKQFGLWR